MTFPGLGGQQSPPQNASPAQQPVVGVQPGVSKAVILANTVIVFGPTGAVVGVFVYAAGTTPALGNEPIASLTNQTSDPYGNPVLPGVAAYTTVGGDQIAIQLGLGSFAGTPAAGMFTHDQTSPATSDPFVGSLGNGTAVIYSGQSTAGATGSGVEAEDSVVSGVPGGEVSIVAGNTIVQGTLTVNGSPNVGAPSPNSTSTNGLSSPGIAGTSGPASAGTAHTHSGGSYVVGSGQHSHDIQNHVHPL